MKTVKYQFVLFIVMFFSALLLNPMNILAYRWDHLYLSQTLVYSALFMASNMIWTHQIVHYIMYRDDFSSLIFFTGLSLSLGFFLLLRYQIGISGKQWLEQMIRHHSTAITTTKELLDKPEEFRDDPKLYRLAKDIVYSQEREIHFMNGFLQNNFA